MLFISENDDAQQQQCQAWINAQPNAVTIDVTVHGDIAWSANILVM